ncbi:MAG TPA: zinc ribbon domain-containing protein [Thermoanaerobaculia bacterium]|nr:zinc ribbon domain-containing protein [Thermoanaerobaculia bacterium]
MICPKCQLELPDSSAECPRCGIVFARWHGRTEDDPPVLAPRSAPPPAVAEKPPFSEWLPELLFEVPATVPPAAFAGRALLAAFLFLWGWRFLLSSVADNYVGSSFLHLVNLPFHEAGHVIFSPFGDFLHTLGGTLGQLLVPAVCLGAFLFYTRDTFGAAVALWWLAENCMDIGPYIADARSGELLLLGGVTGREAPGYHDWENILGTLGLLRYDQTLGALAYGVGRLLMLAAFAWGGYVLARQYRNRVRG